MKERADAEEGQVHGHREVVERGLPEIIGMRIVNVHQGGQVKLQHIAPVLLPPEPQDPRVTAAEGVDDLVAHICGGRVGPAIALRRTGLAGGSQAGLGEIELFLQVLVTQMLAPQLSGFVQVFRIRRLAPVQRETVRAGELKFFRFEQFSDVGKTLFDPLHEPFEDFTRRAGFSFKRQVVEHGAVLVELFQIGFQEMQALAVERLHIMIQKF